MNITAGATGDLDLTNALCQLPQNVMMEKFFCLFWIAVCIGLSFVVLEMVWYLLVLASSHYRMFVTIKDDQDNIYSGLTLMQACGLFLVLKFVSQNVDVASYDDFLTRLASSSSNIGTKKEK